MLLLRRVRHATILILIITLILVFHNRHFTDQQKAQAVLQYKTLEQHSISKFNPRDTTLDLYRHLLNSLESTVTRVGNESGIFFHWDDYIDLSPADNILQSYRLKFPNGDCDDNLRNFASVNAYFLESFSTKVLRGLAMLYSCYDIPRQVMMPLPNTSYLVLPVAGRQRIDYQSLQLNTTREQVLELMSELEFGDYQVIDQAPFNKTISLSLSDFQFDPDTKIAQLENDNDPLNLEYLEFLQYANNYVDTADKFFKYPWIIDDVISGHSHHFAYPFFKRYTTDHERQSVMQHMVRLWFHFALAVDLPSWINYGSLLGWAFNGVNMPWDTDIDIQIPIVPFDKLARDWNGTLILEDPRYGNLKYYLIVLPTYVRQGNGHNFIDARFIDINSGLYIDLSALLHIESDTPPLSFFEDLSQPDEVPVHCKNWNWHSLEELSPLRHTFFEGSALYVPHNVSRILRRKYGPDSYTTATRFHQHNYQQDIDLWVPDKICSSAPTPPLGRFESLNHTQLNFDGACHSKDLMDEYHIVHESALRHHVLNADVDHVSDAYDFMQLEELPLFRKDSWDYYHDIDTGMARDENWYKYQEIIHIH